MPRYRCPASISFLQQWWSCASCQLSMRPRSQRCHTPETPNVSLARHPHTPPGSPEDTPVLLWLVAMADAQSSIKQPAAAAATLQRALHVMIQIETAAEASAAAQRTQRAGTQEQEAQDAAARASSGPGGEQTGPPAESPQARMLAEVRQYRFLPVTVYCCCFWDEWCQSSSGKVPCRCCGHAQQS
jgi:hypothetical protein